MDNEENFASPVLEELFSAFEMVETQSAAILEFMKDKGLATDDDLASYLERAGNASNVRWRAAKLRMNSLIATALQRAQDEFSRKIESRGGADKSTQIQESQPAAKQTQEKSAGTQESGDQKSETQKATVRGSGRQQSGAQESEPENKPAAGEGTAPNQKAGSQEDKSQENKTPQNEIQQNEAQQDKEKEDMAA